MTRAIKHQEFTNMMQIEIQKLQLSHGSYHNTRNQPSGIFVYDVDRGTRPVIITWFAMQGFGP